MKSALAIIFHSCSFIAVVTAAPVHNFERVFAPTPGTSGTVALALAYGNQTFYALGYGQLGRVSADGGYNWGGGIGGISVDTGARDSIVGLANGIVVYRRGQTFQSLLGWQANRVALGNGIFMAAGLRWPQDAGFPSAEYDWVSLDGRTWRNQGRLPYLTVADLIFRDGYFYFLGADPLSNNTKFQMYRTPDSTTPWTKVYETPVPSLGGHTVSEHRMKYSEGEFTAVCSGFIATSTNGTDWKSHPQPLGSPICAAVRIKDGYLAAGRRGFFFSPNLTNWTILKSDWFVDLVYAEGTALALGHNAEIYRCNYEPHLSARTEGDDLVLQVFATAPDRYVIERKDSLIGSDWTKIDEISDLRVRSQKRITNFRTASSAYYRLKKI